MQVKRAVTITMAVILVLILAGLSIPSFAGPGHREGWKGKGEKWDRWASALNLTEDQKSEIQTRREAFNQEIAPLRDQLLTRKQEMKELWAQPDTNRDQILAKQQEISNLKSQIRQEALELRLDIHTQVLTPEQRQKAAELMMSRHKFHGSYGEKEQRFDRDRDGGSAEGGQSL